MADDRAARSFAEGRAAFQRKEYAAAAAAFEQAAGYELHPAPLMNAAEAYEILGDSARVATLCDRVLAIPNVPPDYASRAREKLYAVKSRVATLHVEGPEVLRVRVDGGEESSLPRTFRLSGEKHSLTVIDTGSKTTTTREIAVPVGEEVREVLVARPVPNAGGVVATRTKLPVGMWIAFGVGAATAVTTSIFGVLTVNAKSDYDSGPTPERRDDFYSRRLTTNILLGVTGAAAVTGVVFLLTRKQVDVVVAPLDGGGWITGRLQY